MTPCPLQVPAAARFRTPSGLLTRAAWEGAMARCGEPLADHQDRTAADAPGPDRGFARWVHAEARTLAGQLERLALQPEAAPALSRHAKALAAALAADADWARRHLDGRYDGDPSDRERINWD